MAVVVPLPEMEKLTSKLDVPTIAEAHQVIFL
jgi:hypothetical protein